jgi:hypothetical protein
MAILFALSVTGFGQTTDSIYWDDTHIGIGDGGSMPTKIDVHGNSHITTSGSVGLMPFGWSPTSKLDISVYDTIPVLMLVSDTSHNIFTSYSIGKYIKGSGKTEIIGNDTLISGGSYEYKEVKTDYGYLSPIAYHMKGYEVIQNYHNGQANIHVKYLSSDKKPLNKNIVVWINFDTK